MPWAAIIPAAIGATGAVRGALASRSANRAAEEQNKRRAIQLMYSPYTGRQPEDVAHKTSTLGGILGGGLAGTTAGLGLTGGLKDAGFLSRGVKNE